jgi:hypothetical protein
MAINVIHLQRGAHIKRRLREIDREVADCYDEDYLVDADRLLDERLELAEAREALKCEPLA